MSTWLLFYYALMRSFIPVLLTFKLVATLSMFDSVELLFSVFVGTFTVSNLGMFGVDRFDAILPPGTVSVTFYAFFQLDYPLEI